MKNNNLFRDMNTILSAEDIVMLSPLQLAYIGDAVYELLIRTYLLNKGLSVKELHKATIKYVKAKAQAHIIHELEDILTEEEQTVVKKGRNAKTNTMPKNADMIDYKYATGLEALFGYLYLTNQDKRISELFEEISNIEIN
jgi:ribonuclease-3 family protein